MPSVAATDVKFPKRTSDPFDQAFYESLGKMPGLTVRRDFSESNRLPDCFIAPSAPVC